MHRGRAVLAGFALVGIGASHAARAQTVAVAPGPLGNYSRSFSETTFGYAFNVTAPVTVTFLAYYNGLVGSLGVDHPVGIWDATGTLLVSAVVPAAREALTVDGFRLVQLATPLTLPIGSDYTVGGYNPPSPSGFLTNDPPFAAPGVLVQVTGIEFVEGRTLTNGGFGRPTTPNGTPPGPFYGASFAVGALTVPEPATAALAAVGLAGLGLMTTAGWRPRRADGSVTRTSC